MKILLIAIGGGLGALVRFLVIQFINKLAFPKYFATIFVNLVGSFFIGFVAHKLIDYETLTLFLTVGILGGFTTFSTFSLETVNLLQGKQYGQFFIYICMNMIGGLLLFILGFTF